MKTSLKQAQRQQRVPFDVNCIVAFLRLLFIQYTVLKVLVRILISV